MSTEPLGRNEETWLHDQNRQLREAVSHHRHEISELEREAHRLRAEKRKPVKRRWWKRR